MVPVVTYIISCFYTRLKKGMNKMREKEKEKGKEGGTCEERKRDAGKHCSDSSLRAGHGHGQGACGAGTANDNELLVLFE